MGNLLSDYKESFNLLLLKFLSLEVYSFNQFQSYSNKLIAPIKSFECYQERNLGKYFKGAVIDDNKSETKTSIFSKIGFKKNKNEKQSAETVEKIQSDSESEYGFLNTSMNNEEQEKDIEKIKAENFVEITKLKLEHAKEIESYKLEHEIVVKSMEKVKHEKEDLLKYKQKYDDLMKEQQM